MQIAWAFCFVSAAKKKSKIAFSSAGNSIPKKEVE